MGQTFQNVRWRNAPADMQLHIGEAHVWAAPLDVVIDDLRSFRGSLSAAEAKQADKFRFEFHRNRFIAGRGTLRAILARYLKTDPTQLDIAYGTRGKPELGGKFATLGVYFNVSHSEDLALFAVTRIGHIGIDVEQIRPVKEMNELISRVFSPPENERFQKLSSGDKTTAFFNLWTRKEALLKATGEGITESLSLVEVSFLPDEPACLLAAAGNPHAAENWRLLELSPAPGFVGAMAIRAPMVDLSCWKWA